MPDGGTQQMSEGPAETPPSNDPGESGPVTEPPAPAGSSDDVAKLTEALNKERGLRKQNDKAVKERDALQAQIDELKSGQMSEQEKAIAKAVKDADGNARREVRAEFGRDLALAKLRSAVAGKVEDADEALELIDVAKLVDDEGSPDDGVIAKAAERLIKLAGADRAPDFDGGTRTTAKSTDMNQIIRKAAGV